MATSFTGPVSTTGGSSTLNVIAPTLLGTATGPSPISNASSWITSLFAETGDRIIAIVLGLILIGGAILLYIGEDIGGAIEAGGKVAAKAGELAA